MTQENWATICLGHIYIYVEESQVLTDWYYTLDQPNAFIFTLHIFFGGCNQMCV